MHRAKGDRLIHARVIPVCDNAGDGELLDGRFGKELLKTMLLGS